MRSLNEIRGEEEMETGVLVLVLIFAFFLIYFIPSFVAGSREIKNVSGVLVVNLFLGWTLLGWVVALTWAVAGSVDEKKLKERNEKIKYQRRIVAESFEKPRQKLRLKVG